MTDPISRQALLKKLPHANWGKEWDEALAKAIIESMPTIDPVKHGEWKTTPYTDYDDAWECSACGGLWTFIEGTPKDNGAHYCPNCGSRMEQEDEQN